MSIKLQINSVEALERLIGGDSEIELQIRENVVQDFTNRHLKGLHNNLLSSGINASVRKELIDLKYLKEQGGKLLMDSTLQSLIQIGVSGQFNELISNQISSHAVEAQQTLLDDINKRWERVTASIDRLLSQESVDERLNKLVDSRLKNMLNIK